MVVTSLSIDEYGKWPTRLAQNAIGADLDFIKPDILNQKRFCKGGYSISNKYISNIGLFREKKCSH